MKNNYLKQLFTALFLLCATVAAAHDFEVDGIYYNILSQEDKTVEVTFKGTHASLYSNEYGGSVVVPNSVVYDGTTYSVTSIGDYAFYDCDGLTSIEIPNSVTSIGDYAFYDCDGLTSIEIPNSVTSIGEVAFSNCTGLTSIVIPSSVTSIGDWAFNDCDGLTSIEIPNSVASIGDYAFYDCDGLTSIVIPSSVTSIGDSAFDGCTGLQRVELNCTTIGDWFNGKSTIKEVVIGNSVTSIGGHAFYKCDGLTSIEIGNSVTSIGEVAFYGCTGLTSIEIPNSVTSIDISAFSGCTGLERVELNCATISAWFKGNSTIKEVVIGDSVTSLGNYVFNSCTGLTKVVIGNSVTSIGSYAFVGCAGLSSIEIPNSVKSIGTAAFYNCSGLTSITSLIPAEELFTVDTSVFNGVDKATCTLYVPAGAKSKYASTDGWKDFVNIVELGGEPEVPTIGGSCGENATWALVDSVLTIDGTGDMYDYTSSSKAPWDEYIKEIKSVVIKDGITRIGNYAFYNCVHITNVTIGNSVTSIGNYAFSGCSALTSIEIPNSVTSISSSAFTSCSSLESMVVADGNTVYDSRNNCNAIIETSTNTLAFGCKNTVIPNSVTSIGSQAFQSCSGLTSVEIPNSVTSIGDYAFYGCSGLTSVVIGNSVTSIGQQAFSRCTGLTSVVIPNSVTSIGSYAFYNCSNLTSIVIPNSVTSIGEYAFEGTAWYKNHPNGVVYAGKFLYKYKGTMPGNTSIVIKEGTTVIVNRAFYNCSGLTSVEIPNSVTSIGDYAFYSCSGLTSLVIGNSVTSIGGSAFYGCKGLTSIEIPNSVTSIGSYAFSGCKGLTSIEIPNSVTSIGSTAFQNCSGLTSVVIGNSVTSIASYAFYNCSGLTSITAQIPADALFAVNTLVFGGVDKSSCTLYVPAGAKSKYASTGGWKDFINIVELEPTEVVITIGQYGSTVYSSPYALDFSDVEGLKAYAATGYKTNSQIITLTRVQTAEAGIGVFLKGEPGEYIVPVIESTDEHSLNMLVATLEKTEVNSTSSDGLYANFKYTIKSGDATPLFYRFADGSTLSAGKAYLQIPLAWLPATASKAINIRFDEGETTDIDELQGENGKAKTIYDLSGRAVENPASGIYIIDGKKVYVK